MNSPAEPVGQFALIRPAPLNTPTEARLFLKIEHAVSEQTTELLYYQLPAWVIKLVRFVERYS